MNWRDAITCDDLDQGDDDPEPVCPECGCDLFTELHDWDCGYEDEVDDE